VLRLRAKFEFANVTAKRDGSGRCDSANADACK